MTASDPPEPLGSHPEVTSTLIDVVVAADDELLAHLGIRVASLEDGRCVLESTARSHAVNSAGVVHGSHLFALADTAAAYAIATRGIHAVTIGSSLAFTRPAKAGDEITAEATVETVGNSFATASAQVKSWDRVVAHGVFSFAVVENRLP
jgi:acyl-CoA thioesterase